MRRRRAAAISVALLTGIAGCGPSDSAEVEAPPVPLAIGVLAPLTGDSAASGRGAVAAVNAVIDEARGTWLTRGFALEVNALDDRGEQSVAQQRVTELAGDLKTVALIGSVDSIVDEGVQPLTADVGLAMISLGGTGGDLVDRNGQRPFANYFTVASNDIDRARVAGERALVTGGRIMIVRGDREIDRSMATEFRDVVKAGGSRTVVDVVLGSEFDDPSTDDVSRAQIADRLAVARPDLVYVVTPEPLIWPTLQSIREQRPEIPVILDEPAVGRWSAALVSLEEEAKGRNASFGATFAVTIGPGDNTLGGQGESRTATATAPATEAEEGDVAGLQPGGRFAESAERAARAVLHAVDSAYRESESLDRPSSEWGQAEWSELRGLVIDGLAATYRDAPVQFDGAGVAVTRSVGVFERRTSEWVSVDSWIIEGDCASSSPRCLTRTRDDASATS